jgi:hypothetical protein
MLRLEGRERALRLEGRDELPLPLVQLQEVEAAVLRAQVELLPVVGLAFLDHAEDGPADQGVFLPLE